MLIFLEHHSKLTLQYATEVYLYSSWFAKKSNIILGTMQQNGHFVLICVYATACLT